MKHTPIDISTSSAILYTVNYEFQYTKVLTVLTLSSVSDMDGLPEQWSSSYDS